MAKLIIQENNSSPGRDMAYHFKLKGFGYEHDPGVSDEGIDVFRHPSGKMVGIMPNGNMAAGHKGLATFFHVNNEDEAWNDPKLHPMDHLQGSLLRHHGAR